MLPLAADAGNGGPEDPAILAIEKLGGVCRRESYLGFKFDEFVPRETSDDPVIFVDLEGCRDISAALKELAKLPHLLDLNLKAATLSDDDANEIAGRGRLRSIDFRKGSITPTGLRLLGRRGEPRYLGLWLDRVNDDHLDALIGWRNLSDLSLEATQPTLSQACRVARRGSGSTGQPVGVDDALAAWDGSGISVTRRPLNRYARKEIALVSGRPVAIP